MVAFTVTILLPRKKKKRPLLYFSFLFVLSAPLLKFLTPPGFSDLNYFLYPPDPCHLISSLLTENLTFISQSLWGIGAALQTANKKKGWRGISKWLKGQQDLEYYTRLLILKHPMQQKHQNITSYLSWGWALSPCTRHESQPRGTAVWHSPKSHCI